MEYVITEIGANIGTITVNRPEALNAMNLGVINALDRSVQEMIDHQDVGVLIITGAGKKAFVAGADINAMQQMNSAQAKKFGEAGQKMTRTIETSPKPVIAAVNGFALGGGCEIALACHIRVASENAIFGQPEVHLGLIPGWGGTQRLPKIIGVGIANELITTGGQIAANEAFRIGLVNKVVPLDELLDRCKKIGHQILMNEPNAVARALSCIYSSFGMSIEAGLEVEVNAFADLFETDETREGLTAFVEKRPANFR